MVWFRQAGQTKNFIGLTIPILRSNPSMPISTATSKCPTADCHQPDIIYPDQFPSVKVNNLVVKNRFNEKHAIIGLIFR